MSNTIANEQFDPNKHLIKVKKPNDYLPVQWRLVWFRNECPEGTIETEMVLLDLDKEFTIEKDEWNDKARCYEKVTKTGRGIAVFRTIAKDGRGGIATGHGMETGVEFPDFVEKAETKATGRALAALGYGTQFAAELDEEHRIVDAPVGTQNGSASGVQQRRQAPTPTDEANTPLSQKQLESIQKLAQMLSIQEPENLAELSRLEAKEIIEQLKSQYRELRKQQEVTAK